jgi:L-alanine-DL-glutamate epimerase-like enolase superfamily enzyme
MSIVRLHRRAAGAPHLALLSNLAWYERPCATRRPLAEERLRLLSLAVGEHLPIEIGERVARIEHAIHAQQHHDY